MSRVSVYAVLLWLLAAHGVAQTPACGDCDLNAVSPTILDALAAARIAAGLVVPTPPELCACDVDGSTTVSILDALVIAQAAAGLPAALSCPMSCGNQPPVVTITAPTGGTHSAVVGLVFDALDADGDPLDLLIEVDTGTIVLVATSAGSGSLTSNPAAMQTPQVGFTFDWDSLADGVGGTAPTLVTLRVTAMDATTQGQDQVVVTIDNTPPPAPTTWTQLFPSASPSVRYGFGMVFDTQRDVAVLFGGHTDLSSGTPGSNQTWEWNGTTWTLRTPPLSPPGRYHHAMAYDRDRGVTVIHAGWSTNSVELSDSWEWNGTTWTQIGSGALRWQSKMAYFEPTQTMIAGFGISSSVFYADLWRLTGGTWMGSTPMPAPSARSEVGLEYDPGLGSLLLFGGWPGPSNETWGWNGTTWSNLAPSQSPPAVWGLRMAYDVPRGRMVLFGGTTTGSVTGCLGQTWEWDGVTWQQMSPTTSPSPRIYHGVVYDEARGVITLFGGAGLGSTLTNDTWSY